MDKLINMDKGSGVKLCVVLIRADSPFSTCVTSVSFLLCNCHWPTQDKIECAVPYREHKENFQNMQKHKHTQIQYVCVLFIYIYIYICLQYHSHCL